MRNLRWDGTDSIILRRRRCHRLVGVCIVRWIRRGLGIVVGLCVVIVVRLSIVVGLCVIIVVRLGVVIVGLGWR